MRSDLSRWRWWRSIIAALTLVTLASSYCAASGGSQTCGTNCVYAALKLLGRNASYTDVIDAKYITTPQGSTLDDLKRDVTEHGADAVAVGDLSTDAILSSRDLMLLNVRSDQTSKRYDHWILARVDADSRLLVFDPPRPEREMLKGELLDRWNGAVLFVGREDLRQSTDRLVSAQRWSLVCDGVLLITICALFRVLRGRIGWIRGNQGRVGQIGMLLLLGLCSGLVLEFFRDGGLLAQNASARDLEVAHADDLSVKVDSATAYRLWTESNIFIDARHTLDYADGHIPGAINVPPEMTLTARRQLLESIPLNKKLVLYCQSDSCEFSGELAKALRSDGRSELVLFPGGWLDWIEIPENSSTKASTRPVN